MRSAILVLLSTVVMSKSAGAQREPALSPDMLAMEASLLTKVGPQTRTWIKQEADREASSTISESAARRAVVSSYGGLASVDIEAVTFLVLMQAAKSAQEDLKSVTAGVKAINNAKASLVQSADRLSVRSKEELECLDRISEIESLRLQMAMDRMSKVMSTLSNLLKKISDTANSITQNLK